MILAGAILSTLPVGGCVVTGEILFDGDTNYPPSIESARSALNQRPPTPLGSVVKVDLDRLAQYAEESETGQVEVVFPVVVRDPNVDQTLLYRAFLDCMTTSTELARDRLAPQGTEATPQTLERSLTLRVDPAILTPHAGECCKLELLVSSDFDFVKEREPVTLGDIGTAVWWLAIKNEISPTVEMITCP